MGTEDKGENKEAKAAMARQPHGWAPKEDGHTSNNTVVMAADTAADVVADVAEDTVADMEMDATANVAKTKVFNQCCSIKTTIGTTAGHVDMMCRISTTAKHVTTATKATKKHQQSTI